MKNLLKMLSKTVTIILKLVLCLFFTIVIGMNAAIVSLVKENDWQIIFYVSYLSVTILGLWIVCFIKTNKYIKLVYSIIFISHFYISQLLPSVKKQQDIDTCLDIGVCAEGIEVNTEHGRIKINRENCLIYGWQWDENRKWCDLRH